MDTAEGGLGEGDVAAEVKRGGAGIEDCLEPGVDVAVDPGIGRDGWRAGTAGGHARVPQSHPDGAGARARPRLDLDREDADARDIARWPDQGNGARRAIVPSIAATGSAASPR